MSGSITLVSTGATGQGINGAIMPSISADGTKVAFSSDSSTLVAGDTNNRYDVFIKDLTTGAITRVGTESGGQGNNDSDDPSISADGTKVAFYSWASNLVAGDTNGTGDVFVRDLTTGTITRVGTGASGQGNGQSSNPSISADGRKVAFNSAASNLVAGDTNNRNDVFVVDLATGVVTRATTDAGGQPDSDSFDPSISADGTKVAFYSFASNLIAGEEAVGGNVFVKDLTTGAVTRATVPIDGQTTGLSFAPSISADGTKVAFSSSASNLVADDTNDKDDVFVKDLTTGVVTRVSAGANGGGDDHSYVPSIFPDGSKVAFSSDASNLVAGDTGGGRDLFVKDLTTGAITLISTGANGQANGESFRSSISADGTKIAFESAASNLVAGDTNDIRDVFVKTLSAGTTDPAGTVTDLGPATGRDTLVLSLSQDAYQGNAQYDVSVDGVKLNAAPLSVGAASLNGSATRDTVNIRGDFANGGHNVAVTFLNDQYGGTAATDRNLYVEGATYDDDAVAGGTVALPNASAALLSTGSQATIGFNDISSASPQGSTTTLGTGAHRLVFQVEQDAYQGSAQYDVSVDGTKLNGTPIVASALRGSDQRDVVTVLGDFAAGVEHTLTVDFLNDRYDGTAQTDRNLYVSGTTYDGAPVTGGSLILLSQGPQTFFF